MKRPQNDLESLRRERWAISLKLLISLTALVLGGWILWIGVRTPLLQDQMIKLSRSGKIPPREALRSFENISPFDPYLAGAGELEIARNARALSRESEAVDAYERAVASRNGPEVRVEFGLYLIELGRFEKGKAELLESARYSSSYLHDIPISSIRGEIRSALTSERDAGEPSP